MNIGDQERCFAGGCFFVKGNCNDPFTPRTLFLEHICAYFGQRPVRIRFSVRARRSLRNLKKKLLPE